MRKTRFAIAVILLLASAKAFWDAQSGDASYTLSGWLYLVGGVMFLTYRNYIEIDPDAQRLTHRLGFIHAFVISGHDIGKITHITLKEVRIKSDKGRSSKSYYLLVNGNRSSTLCSREDFGAARKIAERVCRAIRVDFDNQLFGVPSVRTADELDLPLCERWRIRGELKTVAMVGPDSALTVSTDGDATVLTAPNSPVSWPHTVILILVIGGALVWLGSIDATAKAIATVLGVFLVAITLMFIASCSGPIVLRINPTSVEYRYGKSPIRRTIAMADIEELISTEDALHLMGDSGFISLSHPDDPRDRQLQIQFLERQISVRQPAAVDSLKSVN